MFVFYYLKGDRMKPPIYEPDQEIWGWMHLAVCVLGFFMAVFL